MSVTLPESAVTFTGIRTRSNEPEHFVIGELIADGVIAQLSRSPDIRVISRLSTTAFRGRASVMPDVE